jgi:crotonobetainyl-CoA:carnitine CoA-transferase CaiB-like acyl-CoA transferase
MAPRDHGAGPLSGIRVLDISTVYAAPITAMLLGDFGADVVKVEHPQGDPARTHGWNREGHGLWWKVIARNKRTITLNFGTTQGQDLLRRLAADADVLVENFRPGVMEKWGLGPDQLLALNPALVMLRVTGFGQTGPYAQRSSPRSTTAMPAAGEVKSSTCRCSNRCCASSGPARPSTTSSASSPAGTATGRRTMRRETPT